MNNRPICVAIAALLAAASTHAMSAAASLVQDIDIKPAKESRVIEIHTEAMLDNGDGDVTVIRKGPEVYAFKNSKGGSVSHQKITEMPNHAEIDVVMSKALSEAFTPATSSMVISRNVKNAPYSAEVITERTQNLPDGNQITKRSTQMTYRDSAGRTRTEVRDDQGALRSISIHDPVDGIRLMLNPATKSATKISMGAQFEKNIEALRERAKAEMKDGKATIIQRSPGEEIIIKRYESPRGDGIETHEEVKVHVMRSNSSERKNGGTLPTPPTPPTPPMPPVPPGVGDARLAELSSLRNLPMTSFMSDRKWSANATTRDLGSRDFNGVRAEGKLRSYTIPSGEIGNKNAIVVSAESWTAPDLQITVYSKHSDPRAGETVYRVANLNRSEPALTLFSLPEGYTVKEGPNMQFKWQSK